MKIASFEAGSIATWGIVTDNGIIDAGKRLKAYPTLKTLLAKGSLDELKALKGERPDYALAEIELLPTVPDPDKIFCIGVNYATHLAESGHPTPPHPMIFTRFANSQVGGGQPMIRPLKSERFDYEGEMAVIIGKAGRRISRERRSRMSRATPATMTAASATGSATPRNSRPARISSPPAASGRGW